MFFRSSHLEVNSALEYFQLLNRIAEFYFYWQKYPYFFHCEKIQEAITSTSSILASTISPWPCVESEGQFSPSVRCHLSSLEPLLLSPLQKKIMCSFWGFQLHLFNFIFPHCFKSPPPIWTPVYIFTLLCITINLKFNENNFKIIWKYCNTYHNSFYRITICCYTKLHYSHCLPHRQFFGTCPAEYPDLRGDYSALQGGLYPERSDTAVSAPSTHP